MANDDAVIADHDLLDKQSRDPLALGNVDRLNVVT